MEALTRICAGTDKKLERMEEQLKEKCEGVAGSSSETGSGESSSPSSPPSSQVTNSSDYSPFSLVDNKDS